MAGPWEKYGGSPTSAEDGPWAKYAQPAAPGAPAPNALAASNVGLVQGLTFGFGDELMAGALTPIEMGVRAYRGEDWSPSASYNAALERERAGLHAAEKAHPIASAVGALAGGAVGGGGLAKAGLSVGARAAETGAGIGKVAFGSAADGAAMGMAQGFGSGEGVGDRVGGAALGGLYGFGLGGAVPLAVAAAPAVAKAVAAPIMARAMPGAYADDALVAALRRSNMTPDDVAASLRSAHADDQGVFTAADALGAPGQRLLSSTVRNQNDSSRNVAEALMQRQAGQGQRVSGAIDDAFGVDATKRQSMDDLYKWGSEASAPFYKEALSAAPVTSERLQEFLADPIVRSGLAKGMRVQRLEALAKGEKFDPFDYAITGMDKNGDPILDQFPNMRTLNLVKKGFDDILEKYRNPITNKLQLDEEGRAIDMVRRSFLGEMDNLSPVYAKARSLYAGPASIRDDVGMGAMAASRGRAADNIAMFEGKQPANQQGFRIGYADALNQRVERAAEGANRVRPLTSDKYKQEIAAFARPEKVDQFGRRVAREQTMFQTQAEALGNSKTAQRMADDADLAKFDPGVVATLLRGRPISAAVEAITKVVAREFGGMQPGVSERLVKALMESRPDVIQQLLQPAQNSRQVSDGVRKVARAMLTGAAATAAGRAN